MKLSNLRNAILPALALVACGILPDDGAERRGYRFFVESITHADGPDQEEGIITGGSTEIDLLDCIGVDETTQLQQVIIVDANAVANLVVSVLDSFEFVNGLQLRLTHIAIAYTPLDSVDPNNPGAMLQLEPKTIVFGEDEGPVLDVGTNDRLETEIVVPFLDAQQKQEYLNQTEQILGMSLQQQREAFELTGSVGIYRTANYRVTYEFFAIDNFGNRSSTTVEGIVQIADFGDDC